MLFKLAQEFFLTLITDTKCVTRTTLQCVRTEGENLLNHPLNIALCAHVFTSTKWPYSNNGDTLSKMARIPIQIQTLTSVCYVHKRTSSYMSNILEIFGTSCYLVVQWRWERRNLTSTTSRGSQGLPIYL